MNEFARQVQELERDVRTLHRSETKTAALALIYAELARIGITDQLEFSEYLDVDDIGCLSFLTRAAGRRLSEMDWCVVGALADPPQGKGRLSSVAENAYKFDPARAEAMLHAWPKTAKKPPLGAWWTRDMIGPRWDRVEFAMAVYSEHGLAVTPDEIDVQARAAFLAVLPGGATRWSNGTFEPWEDEDELQAMFRDGRRR
jgi:hypothetical protein